MNSCPLFDFIQGHFASAANFRFPTLGSPNRRTEISKSEDPFRPDKALLFEDPARLYRVGLPQDGGQLKGARQEAGCSPPRPTLHPQDLEIGDGQKECIHRLPARVQF